MVTKDEEAALDAELEQHRAEKRRLRALGLSTRTAQLVKVYREDHGSYPSSTDELVWMVKHTPQFGRRCAEEVAAAFNITWPPPEEVRRKNWLPYVVRETAQGRYALDTDTLDDTGTTLTFDDREQALTFAEALNAAYRRGWYRKR